MFVFNDFYEIFESFLYVIHSNEILINLIYIEHNYILSVASYFVMQIFIHFGKFDLIKAFKIHSFD